MRTWRDLLSGLTGRQAVPSVVLNDDPFARPDDAREGEPDPLSSVLDEIERGALGVYAAAGLPTRSGHYRRGPRASGWTFVAERLDPSERFDLMERRPPEKGWRFARLQDLGAYSSRDNLRAASRLLNDIVEIRTAHAPLTRRHLMVAMELGGAWRSLLDAQTIRDSRPISTGPAKPRGARDKKTPSR